MSKKYQAIVEKDGVRYFHRFSSHQRVQHVCISSVIILALTGFHCVMQKSHGQDHCMTLWVVLM